MTWVGIVANGRSGRGAGHRQVARLEAELATHHLGFVLAWTPDERRSLVARSAADPDCRCLVAVGGDGTVAALINDAPSVPVTVLPAGTENLFARHFRMAGRADQVARTIAHGDQAQLDLGVAEGRRFVLMASIGFDADVIHRHHSARRGTTSRAAYVEPVLRASLGYSFPALTIRVEDPPVAEPLTGAMAFVFNLPAYALGLAVAPTARGDDGELDLLVFREPGPFQALRYLWLVARGLHLRRYGVIHKKVRRVTVSADRPVPVQLDGDPSGIIDPTAKPWSAQVLPFALTVLLPPVDQTLHLP